MGLSGFPSSHEMSNSVSLYPFLHDILSHHGPRNNKPTRWTETSEAVSEMNLPSFKWFPQAFCHSYVKLMSTLNFFVRVSIFLQYSYYFVLSLFQEHG